MVLNWHPVIELGIILVTIIILMIIIERHLGDANCQITAEEFSIDLGRKTRKKQVRTLSLRWA